MTTSPWLLAAVLSSAVFLGCVRTAAPTGPNNPPVIDSLQIAPLILRVGQPAVITCYAHDPDGDELRYHWSASAGAIVGSGFRVHYIPDPCCGGLTNTITVVVKDEKGGSTQGQLHVAVSP
jgi:hypothetical protein